jgi:hypothetical protein
MQSNLVVCCAIAWMLVFASMAFAEPSGPPGGDDQNGTGGQHNGGDQNGTGPNGPMNYANVTISLIADYDAHYCALDVNYVSSQLEIDKLINITGGEPNASISDESKQFVMMLNKSLSEGGGSFTCQLFTNGSGAGNQDGGGSQGSGQQEHPPIDPNGTAKCNGAEQDGKPAPDQLISGISHLLEKGSPGSKPDPNISSMLAPLCPFGLPYANVTVNLILDNDTRSCFLGINYISRTESFDKRLNITSTVPSPEAGRRQAILVLNSSLAAAGGSFRCVLFSNGSAECRGKEGNAVPFPALALRDAGIGKGLNDPSLPGPNDTNGLSILCPYGANATVHENETHDDDGDGIHPDNETNNTVLSNITGNLTVNYTEGSGSGAGSPGMNNVTITHGNVTGQVGAKTNVTNATAAQANATSNTGAAGRASAVMIFVAAIVIVAVVALLLYAAKRGRPSPSARK